MDLPLNPFKQALREGRFQTGLWLGLNDSYAAEIAACAGFDWLLIDGEHAPFELRTILSHLQTIAAYPSHPVVRPVDGQSWRLKQLLDAGAQSFLVPMIETAEQAAEVASAVRYPPQGTRGVGTALARAARWNMIPNYLPRANDQICLLVQVETVLGLENLDAIAATDGVDGVFIGPADLAASMGYLGQPGHPAVRAEIDRAVTRITAAGKAPGFLSTDPAIVRHYRDLGALFIAVGVDTLLLARAVSDLAATYRT